MRSFEEFGAQVTELDQQLYEGNLHKWYKSKSKDGKPGWVNVKTGGTCASDEPGEGVPKCVSRSKFDSMSDKEKDAAHRAKRREDPGQQSKSGASKPTNVKTDRDVKEACWSGYTAKGMKKKGNKMVPNCVKEGDEMKGLTQKGGHKRSTESGAGLTQKGVDAVNRKTGGNLKTAVTTPPSKLKPGSKAAKRRKSFCARSRSWDGERGKAARRRWNC